jgi:phosphatidylserine/phosphatidylglycerophosphate/cardiolipin synthase-like enzyme
MSPGRRPSAPEHRRRDQLVLEPAERRAAMLRLITRAKRRVILSIFRCDDFEVLDALAAALDRGASVQALLTRRARGGRKSLKRLWDALEGMGATVSWFADAVVKYHAKYLVADEGPAMVTTLNPTRKCFTRTWDAVLITHDPAVARSLTHLFDADANIRILDHKLTDPDMVALLRVRRADGVTVSVVGAAAMGSLAPHGKLIIVDEARAVLGSMALSTLSLDVRREVALVVDDAAAVRRLNVAYQELAVRAGVHAHRLPGDPM